MKIIWVMVAAVAGAGVGAMLGHGPLLQYKAQGTLRMEMDTGEYKRFAELASDASSVRQFAAVLPPAHLSGDALEPLIGNVTRGDWHKPVPKVSKSDAKELPDILLQMAQAGTDKDPGDSRDSKDRRDSRDSRDSREPIWVYLGLRLTYFSPDPNDAAELATWLGEYFKDVATREAVRDQTSRWAAQSEQFAERAMERRLKYTFDIQQAQTRVVSLKKLVASYPESARSEVQQVVDVRKDNEKFISPMAQLVGAESEIIDAREKIQKLDREIEQQKFVKALTDDAKGALSQARSGSESLLKLTAVLAGFSKKVKTDAEQEKLLSLSADLSRISARFLSQSRFIAKPSVPTSPERPRPLMVAALTGLLAALLATIFIWRQSLVKWLWPTSGEKV